MNYHDRNIALCFIYFHNWWENILIEKFLYSDTGTAEQQICWDSSNIIQSINVFFLIRCVPFDQHVTNIHPQSMIYFQLKNADDE